MGDFDKDHPLYPIIVKLAHMHIQDVLSSMRDLSINEIDLALDSMDPEEMKKHPEPVELLHRLRDFLQEMDRLAHASVMREHGNQHRN